MGPRYLRRGLISVFVVPRAFHEAFAKYVYLKGLAEESKVLDFVKGRKLPHLQRLMLRVEMTCIWVSCRLKIPHTPSLPFISAQDGEVFLGLRIERSYPAEQTIAVYLLPNLKRLSEHAIPSD